MRGPSMTCHGTQLSWLVPTPQNWDNPLLVAPESPVRTLRFLLQRVHHQLVGGGAVGMGGRRGVGPRGQAPAPRGGQRVVGLAT